ncbi:MAG: hypothetical protein U0P46_13645 [Holophagaceae bacterium]
MPYFTELTHEGRGLLRIGQGVLTGREIIDAITAFPESVAAPERLTHCLVDLAKVTRLDVSNHDLETIIALDKHHLKSTGLTRAAIAAPADLAYGISNMYRGHAAHQGLEIGVFRTLAEARAWLYSEGMAGA